MSWVDAIREYAKESGKFSIPKKDSPEYAKVKAIQERLSVAAKEGPAVVSKPKKTKAVKVPNTVEALPVVAEIAEAKPVVKAKKVKAVKIANDEMAVADEPVAVEEPVKPKKIRKAPVKVANAAEAKPDVVQVAPIEVKRKGPKLVDRGMRIANTPITLTFE